MLPPRELEKHSLTIRSLGALGQRKVRLRIWIRWPKALWPALTPEERKARLDAWLRERYRMAVAKWGPSPITRIGSPRSPSGFYGEVEARAVPALVRRLKNFDLSIDHIAGRRPRREPARKPSWFAIRARIAIRVQGETTGRQTIEDSIVIARAWTDDEARAKARKEWRSWPSLGVTGNRAYVVEWKLEKIVESIELFDENIRPEGTEVWWAFSKRRLKPEYVWRQPKTRAKARPKRSRRSTHR